MRIKILFSTTALIFAIFLAGCSSNQPLPSVSTQSSSNSKNSSENPPANDSTMNTVKKPVEETFNEAPTLKPVFTAYCDAMTKKDEAALRNVYSAETLKSFLADMKEAKETSLVKYQETDRVSNKLCEIRNEKIEGDTGVAEIKTEGAPNGFKIKFVKENGEWKITNESPDFDAVKKSATNSNTAK